MPQVRLAERGQLTRGSVIAVTAWRRAKKMDESLSHFAGRARV
jgi:hypothetical protein